MTFSAAITTHKCSKIILGALCLPFLLPLLTCQLWAMEAGVNAPDAKLESRIKHKRIEKNILAHKQRIKQTETQEFNLTQELQRLDNLLRQGQEKLINLQQKLLRQETHLQTKDQEISLIETEKTAIEKHIKKRLTAFYQNGDMAFINTLFSATTLPDLLNIEEYFQALFHYDQKIIYKYRTKLTLLQTAKETIALEKNRILATISDARNQEDEIIDSRLQREELLSQVKTQEELYRQALFEMEKAATSLAKRILARKIPTLSNPKKKITRLQSSKKKKPLPETGFAARRGYLSPPVKVGKIIRFFGLYTDDFGTEINSSGIDFEVEKSEKIVSIAEGTVMYTGQIAGYGRLIIIDHGMQYFSLMSNLGELYVKEGETIEEGNIVGVYSGQQQLQGTGIHFEIRQGATPVDPLLWLDHEQLTIDETKASNYIK